MRLNTIQPAPGAKSARKRVGRGRGSGHGRTAGRGDKGQKSRSGGYHKVGFEGGQMPLQRRLPKRGFRSSAKRHAAEIRLHDLAKVDGDVVDLDALYKAGVIGRHITRAKAILSGEITRAVTLRGIAATAGARRAIEAAGGTVEAMPEAAAKSSTKASTNTATESAAKASTKTSTKASAKKSTKKSTKASTKKSAANPAKTPAEAQD